MIQIDKIGQLKTPFYYYDIELLRRTIEIVRQEAQRYDYTVHYAIKANFEDRIVDEMMQAGFGADCVSGNEVSYSLERGFAASQIVFAGVGKSDEEINIALDNRIFAFNCESQNELEVINELAQKKSIVADVALRINPNINPNTHKYITTGKSENKFGISYEEIERIVQKLDALKNINIVGLHFHIGSQILDLNDFRKLTNRINELQEWFEERGLQFEHINVGGGLGIDYLQPDINRIPDFQSYFQLFHDGLHLRDGQKVHFELGRSLVGQCGTLITKVLYKKITTNSDEFILVDAGMTDLIRPSLYQAKHYISNISTTSDEKKKYHIGGPVCESSDVFAKDIELPVTDRGDLLAIWSAGAYGQSMASRYNLRDFAQAVYSDKL